MSQESDTQAVPLSVKIKIENTTASLERSYGRMLMGLSPENADTICDYISAQNGIKNSTKEWHIKILVYLSRFTSHKPFGQMTKEDIQAYLKSLEKSEREDKLHRWIGTYNNRVLVYTKFFRWLYNPGETDREKIITPACIQGIKQLKRKEKSAYQPNDMWTPVEHTVFLKHCPSKRDRCYVAIVRDTSARPHELLQLKIGDVRMLKDPSTGRQYAEIHVIGKTGARTLPLIDSLPYLKDWLEDHPQIANPEAPLFTSQSDKNGGAQLTIDGIWWHMKYYKTKYFPKLLSKPSLSEADKRVIEGLLKKPWNPYVFRHSALTEKAQILTEANLRSYAGWSNVSKMPSVYLHFLGNEAGKSLLAARGIIGTSEENKITQNKLCPHCNEPNRPDSKFCSGCKLVLSYDAYSEIIKENEKTKETVNQLRENLRKITAKIEACDKQNDRIAELQDKQLFAWMCMNSLISGENDSKKLTGELTNVIGEDRALKAIKELSSDVIKFMSERIGLNAS